MNPRFLSLLASVATATITATATAQTSSPEAAAAPEPANDRHTGFFFRGALGGGGLHDDFKVPILFNQQLGGTASGASGSFEASFGWSVRPGLIIGGGIYGEQVVNPKITFQGSPVTSDIHVGTLIMVGPFIDWYPKQGNFHFGGALTAARVTLSDNSGNVKDQSPAGGAAVAEVGYDFPFTDDARFALGIMARFVGGYLSDASYNHSITAGSLLLSLTYD